MYLDVSVRQTKVEKRSQPYDNGLFSAGGAAAGAPFSSLASYAWYGAGVGTGFAGSGVVLANAQLEPCRVAHCTSAVDPWGRVTQAQPLVKCNQCEGFRSDSHRHTCTHQIIRSASSQLPQRLAMYVCICPISGCSPMLHRYMKAVILSARSAAGGLHRAASRVLLALEFGDSVRRR